MPSGIDPNLFASLAQAYTGGIRAPTGPEQAGRWARADASGVNLEYSAEGPVGVADITGYGGAADWIGPADGLGSATDNSLALARLKAANPSGCTIRIPYRGTGVYYFTGNALGDLDGYVLDVDEGVHLRTPTGYSIHNPLLRVVRPVRYDIEAGCIYEHSPYVGKSELHKSVMLHAGDIDQATTHTIDLTAEGSVVDLAFPTVGFTAIETPSAADQYVATTTAGGGLLRHVFVPCLDGDEITASFAADATWGGGVASFCARLADGGYSIAFQRAVAASVLVQATRKLADPYVQRTCPYPGSATHTSYSPHKSLCTIHVHNRRSFSVLYNGTEVCFVADTGADIVDVGFGCGYNNAANSVPIQYWTRTKRKQLSGKRSLPIYVIGDSISDPATQGNWPLAMCEAIESTGGLRVSALGNQAVPGQTSGNQLTVLQAAEAANILDAYDDGIMCIQVGVNDMQGSIPVATYTANLEAIIAIGKSHRMTIVAGLPTMYYTRVQAALFGKLVAPAGNYEIGAPYRAAAMWVFAQRGVKIVPVLDELGPVVADWLATDKDPIVRDAIHPGSHANRLMGYAYARAILGALQPAAL